MSGVLIFLTAWAFAARAESMAPPDAPTVQAQLKPFGVSFDSVRCQPVSLNGGKGEQRIFLEAGLNCGDLKVQIDAVQGLKESEAATEVTSQVAKIRGEYAAAKNPYAGYVSNTTQCPERENLELNTFNKHPMLIGRVSERGVWGACSKEKSDYWSALAFVEHVSAAHVALTKMTVTAKIKLTKKAFSDQVTTFLKSVRVR